MRTNRLRIMLAGTDRTFVGILFSPGLQIWSFCVVFAEDVKQMFQNVKAQVRRRATRAEIIVLAR